MWRHRGSEASAEHLISDDLIHWKRMGSTVTAGEREGCFDGLMGCIAPHVIEHAAMHFSSAIHQNARTRTPQWD
jgi:hypothetical protein